MSERHHITFFDEGEKVNDPFDEEQNTNRRLSEFILSLGGVKHKEYTMATLKIIDRKDKFLIEVDGSKVW